MRWTGRIATSLQWADLCWERFSVSQLPYRRAVGDRWFRSSAAGLSLVLLFAMTASLNAQFRATQWTTDTGLPQNSVRGIVQAPDGYLWVATLNGVAKFDGIRFHVFDKSNSPGISSSRFVSMVSGAGSDLWFNSEDDNVVRYHDGRFATMGDSEGIRPRSVGAISTDHHGGVWVESDNHIFHWIAAKGRFEREDFSSDDLKFVPLRWVGTGFWAVRGSDLVTFARGRLQSVPIPKTLRGDQIQVAAVGADGVVWVGTGDGRLGRYQDGQLKFESGSVLTDFQGAGKQNWKVEISPTFQRTLNYPSGGVDHGIRYNFIIHDNEGNLWVGSDSEGLFRIEKQSIRTISTAQGLASDNVYPVLHSRTGDMWIGSWPAGLSRIHDGKVITALTKKQGVPGLVTALAEDNTGDLWIGTHAGVRVLSHGALVVPPGLANVQLPTVMAIHQRPDGSRFLGTPDGVYVLDGSNSHWLTSKDGLVTNDVRVIIDDHRGDIWIGGYGGLTRLHNGQFTRWTEADGLPSNNIRSIMEDRSGDIWVGTYDGGIGWLRNGKWVVFNKNNGLHDNGAFQILEDDQEHFWISSNSGIYRVSRAELQAVADGRESRVISVAFGLADGMSSAECNGGVWPAGARDDRGLLWFPTQKGVAVVDPTSVVAVKTPPRVEIESASIEDKPQPEVDHVVLRPRQTDLEIEYTALSYTRPEQISFRFKLDGLDKGWQEVGPRRTAYYSHLPPGDYVFRVAARNGDSVVSVHDSTMLITVVPPFYRRWWFAALILLVVLTILWALLHYRIGQLKKEKAAQQAFSRELIASQESERRRIAAELHDSLGQRLIIINNLALFLLRPKAKAGNEEERLQTIEEIKSEATQAIEETRAISYALRPFQLDRLGLKRAIQALAKTVTRASQIEIATDVDDIDDAFDEDLRINFYRIVQEGLNNVVKHSGATHANVVVKRMKSAVVLTVSDNGRGLPSEPRSASAGPSGFGLTGMRERAMLLNGTMQIKSEPGVGTFLTMEFPVGVREPSWAT
jgi:signal transduction histidine kinase/ligand-binding sensor domain-containing protein